MLIYVNKKSMMLSTKNPTKPKGQMKKMVVIDGQYKKKEKLILLLIE